MTLPGHLADPNFRYSVNEYAGDGSTTQWSLTFVGGYISRNDIGACIVNDDGTFTELPFTWVGDSQISITPAVPSGKVFRIYRSTTIDAPLVDFMDGAFVHESNLDLNAEQAVKLAAEAKDAASLAVAVARVAVKGDKGDQGDQGDPGTPVGDELGSSTTVAPSQRAVVAGIKDTPFDQVVSGQFYEEYGAKISRLNDRVFVGAATEHLGTNAGNQPDWLTQYFIAKGRTFGLQHVAQLAVLSRSNPAGENAFVAGARTSDLTAAGNSIGITGIGVNNNATYATGAWGAYFEGYQNSGSLGPAYGLEIDTINFNGAVTTSSYAQGANQVVALQLASGAEYSSGGLFAASAAIALRNNGSTFQKGIIFGSDAISGSTGDGTGTATAIQMAAGQGLQWVGPGGVTTSQIFSRATSTNAGTTINFSNNTVDFASSASGKLLLQVIISQTMVNGIQMFPSDAGATPKISAIGDDTNIDLLLAGKGTGAVRFGTWASNADAAVNGYVTIKDASGNVRKLATIA